MAHWIGSARREVQVFSITWHLDLCTLLPWSEGEWTHFLDKECHYCNRHDEEWILSNEDDTTMTCSMVILYQFDLLDAICFLSFVDLASNLNRVEWIVSVDVFVSDNVGKITGFVVTRDCLFNLCLESFFFVFTVWITVHCNFNFYFNLSRLLNRVTFITCWDL